MHAQPRSAFGLARRPPRQARGRYRVGHSAQARAARACAPRGAVDEREARRGRARSAPACAAAKRPSATRERSDSKTLGAPHARPRRARRPARRCSANPAFSQQATIPSCRASVSLSIADLAGLPHASCRDLEPGVLGFAGGALQRAGGARESSSFRTHDAQENVASRLNQRRPPAPPLERSPVGDPYVQGEPRRLGGGGLASS